MRKRKRKSNLSYDQKRALIIKQMILNSEYHIAQYGTHVGFTMSAIASMIGYTASTALLKTLFDMCDDGYLIASTRTRKTGVSLVEYSFYLPEVYERRSSRKGELS